MPNKISANPTSGLSSNPTRLPNLHRLPPLRCPTPLGGRSGVARPADWRLGSIGSFLSGLTSCLVTPPLSAPPAIGRLGYICEALISFQRLQVGMPRRPMIRLCFSTLATVCICLPCTESPRMIIKLLPSAWCRFVLLLSTNRGGLKEDELVFARKADLPFFDSLGRYVPSCFPSFSLMAGCQARFHPSRVNAPSSGALPLLVI